APSSRRTWSSLATTASVPPSGAKAKCRVLRVSFSGRALTVGCGLPVARSTRCTAWPSATARVLPSGAKARLPPAGSARACPAAPARQRLRLPGFQGADEGGADLPALVGLDLHPEGDAFAPAVHGQVPRRAALAVGAHRRPDDPQPLSRWHVPDLHGLVLGG